MCGVPRRFICGGCDLYCAVLAHMNADMNEVVRITGEPAETIRDAARPYATTGPAIIPWGYTLDT